jgi:HAD superfamily hydrolase (TIGR01509 family)
MSSRRPELICFDLGRVLIRICDNWRHACEIARVPTPSRELNDAAKAQLHDLVCRSERGAIDLDAFAREASSLFEIDPAHVVALSNAYLISPFPGVRELIDDLNSHGLRTACLSNTNASHWEMMIDASHRAGLPLNRLTYRFASHLIGARKPDDAIYAHVERETGLRGKQILFFDDLEENIEGARHRGWLGHLIERCDDPVMQMRRHLSELGVL